MTAVNYIFPFIITKLVDKLERWDFASEALRADLLKNYFTSMLNIIFFMGIQLFKLKMSNNPKEDLKGSDFECKEDALTDELLKLLTGEIVLRGVYYLYWNIYLKLKDAVVKGFDWRTEFELSDEFVWFLTIQLIMWSAMIMYPIISIFQCLFCWLHIRFLIYRLNNQKVQPEMSSNDASTGSTMNMYLNFTFIIVCGFYSFLIFDATPRHKFVMHRGEGEDSVVVNGDPVRVCGPFTSNNDLSPAKETQIFPNNDKVTRIVFCYLIQSSVFTVLYMFTKSFSSKIQILERVQEIKFKEFETKIKS